MGRRTDIHHELLDLAAAADLLAMTQEPNPTGVLSVPRAPPCSRNPVVLGRNGEVAGRYLLSGRKRTAPLVETPAPALAARARTRM